MILYLFLSFIYANETSAIKLDNNKNVNCMINLKVNLICNKTESISNRIKRESILIEMITNYKFFMFELQEKYVDKIYSMLVFQLHVSINQVFFKNMIDIIQEMYENKFCRARFFELKHLITKDFRILLHEIKKKLNAYKEEFRNDINELLPQNICEVWNACLIYGNRYVLRNFFYLNLQQILENSEPIAIFETAFANFIDQKTKYIIPIVKHDQAVNLWHCHIAKNNLYIDFTKAFTRITSDLNKEMNVEIYNLSLYTQKQANLLHLKAFEVFISFIDCI